MCDVLFYFSKLTLGFRHGSLPLLFSVLRPLGDLAMEPSGIWEILQSFMLIALVISGTGMWITVWSVPEGGAWLMNQFRQARDVIAKTLGR